MQWQLRAVEGDAPPIRFASTLETRELTPGHVEPFTEAFFESPPDLPEGAIVSVIDRTGGAVAPGEYELRVSRQLEDGRMIRLANEGRDDDGWYTLGKVVAKQEQLSSPRDARGLD